MASSTAPCRIQADVRALSPHKPPSPIPAPVTMLPSPMRQDSLGARLYRGRPSVMCVGVQFRGQQQCQSPGSKGHMVYFGCVEVTESVLTDWFDSLIGWTQYELLVSVLLLFLLLFLVPFCLLPAFADPCVAREKTRPGWG